jgi:hypothetical protein
MNLSEIQTIIGQVTPLGIACLFALWSVDHPVAESEIAFCLSKDRHTTAGALARLEIHGLASRSGAAKHYRWWLTDRGRQLDLPGLSMVKFTIDGKKTTIEASHSICSSGSLADRATTLLNDGDQTTTTTALDGKKITIDADTRELIDYLAGFGLDRGRVEAAVLQAVGLYHQSTDRIEKRFLYAVLYAESPLGDSIRSSYHYALSRIEKNLQAPVFLHRVNVRHVNPEIGLAWRRWQESNEAELKRIDELDRRIGEGA